MVFNVPWVSLLYPACISLNNYEISLFSFVGVKKIQFRYVLLFYRKWRSNQTKENGKFLIFHSDFN